MGLVAASKNNGKEIHMALKRQMGAGGVGYWAHVGSCCHATVKKYTRSFDSPALPPAERTRSLVFLGGWFLS